MASPPDSQQRLRGAGLRVTAPRIAVLEALDEAEGHVTAEQVRQSVLARLGSVSVQTVYDVLSALTAAGLVRCLETPGHPARFETRVGDNHHHFICRACGKTIDIDCASGETPCLTPVALPSGFQADEAEVTYWGTCSDCRDHMVGAQTSPAGTTHGTPPASNPVDATRSSLSTLRIAPLPAEQTTRGPGHAQCRRASSGTQETAGPGERGTTAVSTTGTGPPTAKP